MIEENITNITGTSSEIINYMDYFISIPYFIVGAFGIYLFLILFDSDSLTKPNPYVLFLGGLLTYIFTIGEQLSFSTGINIFSFWIALVILIKFLKYTLSKAFSS